MPRCEQDWIRWYRFRDDLSPFLLCAECDSVWWREGAIGIATASFLDDVVASHLRMNGNPWVDRVWADVIEPMPDLA